MTTIDRPQQLDRTSPPTPPDPPAGDGRVARALRRLGDRRVLLVAGVLAAALATVLFATSGRSSLAAVAAACGAPAPDTRLTTSADEVAAFLATCGDDGRAAWRDLQVVDLVYPAALGVFLASAVALLLPRVRPGRPVGRRAALLPLVPLVAAGADYLENACAWWLLGAWPQPAALPAHVLGVASATKQATSWASGLLVVGLLAAVAVRRVRAR